MARCRDDICHEALELIKISLIFRFRRYFALKASFYARCRGRRKSFELPTISYSLARHRAQHFLQICALGFSDKAPRHHLLSLRLLFGDVSWNPNLNEFNWNPLNPHHFQSNPLLSSLHHHFPSSISSKFLHSSLSILGRGGIGIRREERGG